MSGLSYAVYRQVLTFCLEVNVFSIKVVLELLATHDIVVRRMAARLRGLPIESNTGSLGSAHGLRLVMHYQFTSGKHFRSCPLNMLFSHSIR